MKPERVQEILDQLIALLSTWGLQVIGAIAVLVIGRIVAGLLRRGARRALTRAKVDATLVPFLAGLVYYAATAVVLIAVLGLFGIETTSLVAVLGAAGLAIGLALQGTLSNFAAGVMLLVFRPLRMGHFVEVDGTKGTVVEIGLFTTTLNSPDNVRIIVPNSGIFNKTITNFSANPTRRIDLVMGVDYGDDLGVAQETMLRVLRADERVLEDPAPLVAVSNLGDSSVDFNVRPWCKTEDYWPLRYALIRALKEELEKAGCSIPFPQRDVHFHQAPGESS